MWLRDDVPIDAAATVRQIPAPDVRDIIGGKKTERH
jgi:hypothetical protein